MGLLDEVRARPQLPTPDVRQAIRRKAHVPQDRMARELGVHRVTFLRWERGDRTPRGAQLDAYARLLRELEEATHVAAALRPGCTDEQPVRHPAQPARRLGPPTRRPATTRT